jgi:hypothetical protein
VCGQVTFICMYGAELYQYKFIWYNSSSYLE